MIVSPLGPSEPVQTSHYEQARRATPSTCNNITLTIRSACGQVMRVPSHEA